VVGAALVTRSEGESPITVCSVCGHTSCPSHVSWTFQTGVLFIDDISKKTYKVGATVNLPETDGLWFAEVNLKPTLAGRLLIALFNPPQLKIVLGLENGSTKTFRVVSNMMKTDFLLSPLVSNTGEFASLMARSKHPQNENRVRTIAIAPSYGGTVYWSGTYELTLKKYVGE
jgi:hypothetical protein